METKIYNSSDKLLKSFNINYGASGKLFVDFNILKATKKILKIKCNIPILDVQGYWTADLIHPQMQLDWSISFSCAAHRNFPFMSFFNDAHQNRGSIGLSNLMDDAVFSAKMNQETCEYDLEIMIAVSNETVEFEIFVDRENCTWLNSLAKYRSFVRPKHIFYPDAAWNPVYCTWYAVHANFEKNWLETNAVIASQLGCGTLIVDDGWCFDDMKRVTPETITTWYEKIGDWEVSEKKLPEFKVHVSKIKAMGLKYLLWISPFFVGVKSKLYRENNCDYLSEEHEGYRVFDPANQAIASKSMDKIIGLVKKYDLDGLKIDFIDSIPQSVATPHGRDIFSYVKRLISKIKEYKSDAMIEFRQRYTTPLMLDQATQFRAGDVPFDFIENLHRIAQIRICVGDHIPVHADPVYWHQKESLINIARHMICSLAGVPMISMDLSNLPEEHSNIIKFWLNFYQEHLDIFKQGHWQIRYEKNYLLYITVELELEKIIFLCDAKYVSESISNFSGKVYLLNLSNDKVTLKNCTVFDGSGKSSVENSIPIAGLGTVAL